MNQEFTDEFYVEFWQDVKMTEAELNAMCDAADAGDMETAEKIVDAAWNRVFGETVN